MKVAGCKLRFLNPSGAISSTHPHGKSFPLISSLVWHRNAETKQEMKLTEKIYRVDGWMR